MLVGVWWVWLEGLGVFGLVNKRSKQKLPKSSNKSMKIVVAFLEKRFIHSMYFAMCSGPSKQSTNHLLIFTQGPFIFSTCIPEIHVQGMLFSQLETQGVPGPHQRTAHLAIRNTYLWPCKVRRSVLFVEKKRMPTGCHVHQFQVAGGNVRGSAV